MTKFNAVKGLPVDLYWPETVDPENWRNQPDPDGEEENDEEVETPSYIISILGFNPDEFDE